MALHIYDGLNWFRQVIEMGNFTIRQLYNQLAFQPPHNTTIIVWEGKGGNERRRKFYLDYKRNRVRPHEDIFRALSMFQELITHTPVYQIAIPGYEGDDVIASLANYYCQQNPGFSTDVFIHSTDKDFRQLGALGVKLDSNPIKVCEDRYIRLYKTLVGDPSDNIKGLKGFGEVAFSRLDCKYVLPFFEREDFTGFLPELALMEQKHFNKLVEDRALIATYWKITGFFNIPMAEMGPHLRLGVANPQAAEEMMRRYIIN